MHKRVIDEAPSLRIGCNVAELIPEILCAANPVLVEAGLPDFPVKLRSHLMRKAALDALGATLDRLIRERGQQDVEMFRHNGESMQVIAPLIPIVKEYADQQLGVCRSYE